MQKLCNLLTNFALCFDRAHKEKRCPFKTDSITLFTEGGTVNKRGHVLGWSCFPGRPAQCTVKAAGAGTG